MKLLLHVDTNDYDGDNSDLPSDGFSLFGLKLKTFQDWNVAGQTGFWSIDGDPYCGTAYDCEINYCGTDAELLLRCLVAKIKEFCEGRFIKLWINGLEVEFTDDDLVLMRREWIETMKGN